MKRLLLLIITLCLLMASCETNQQKKSRKQREIEETAHSHNCMTLEEFCSLKYSYVFEKKLPCLVYLDEFHVSDIVSKIYEPQCVISGADEEDEDFSEEEFVRPFWIGEPSSRQNECWMKGWLSSSQYIGLDKTQVDWAIQKTKNGKTIHTPMIIKIYQVGFATELISSHFIQFKADLIAILNEE